MNWTAIIGSRVEDAVVSYPVREIILSIPKGDWIVTGDARGVDSCVARLAKNLGVPWLTIPAEWDRLGKAAGPIRNEVIVSLASVVYALWDGESPGTRSVIKLTEKYPCELIVHNIVRAGVSA